MPGRNNASNKFGFSSHIVGPVLGDGCNYSVIQDAINDLLVAGGGVVLIRPGVYTEDLALFNGVDLFGASVDGRIPAGLGQVDIIGNHVFSSAGPFEIVIATNIAFTANAGDILTINAGPGSSGIVAMQDCGLFATANPASRCVVFNSAVGGGASFSTDNCQISSASHCFENVGVGSGAANLQFGDASSSSGSVLEISSGFGSLSIDQAQASSSGRIVNENGTGATVFLRYSELFCSTEACFFTNFGTLDAFHSIIQSFAGSGFFIDGAAGSINYENLVLTGTATGISGTITPTVYDWKPYGTTTNVGVNRYNPAQFTVAANGEVSTIASGMFPWIDQGASTTVLSNTGNFTTAVITLTLPAAPAQGDVCKFKQITNDNIVVAANVGQIIQVGNAGGTMAASSSSGDALELTFYAAGAIWMGNSVIGNWTIS